MRRVLEIVAAGFRFRARFEELEAPATVAAFKATLPFEDRIIHCRWSGESNWIPWGDRELGIGAENATCYPAPGQLLLYPGGVSETELLFPYGHCAFGSKAGALAGNHFATIVEGGERFAELGRLTLWEGAQPISFRLSAAELGLPEGSATGHADDVGAMHRSWRAANALPERRSRCQPGVAAP